MNLGGVVQAKPGREDAPRQRFVMRAQHVRHCKRSEAIHLAAPKLLRRFVSRHDDAETGEVRRMDRPARPR
jgi:hypothetical protein